MRRSTLTTAGSFTRRLIVPPSTSRPTRSDVSPSLLIDPANVACGQPRYSARSWATWFESPSTACLPARTRSASPLDDRLERARHDVAVELLVGRVDADRLVGAGREGAPERRLGLLRAERHDDDLSEARLRVRAVLREPERGLDRVLVERVGLPLETGRLELASVDLHLVRVVGIGDALQRDEDLHREKPPTRPSGSLRSLSFHCRRLSE